MRQPIKRFPNYLIDESGLIFSLRSQKILKPYFNKTKSGRLYLYVSLAQGRNYKRAVHRLLAESFLPNPFNLPYVDHIDNDTLNNCVDNLRWCTASQNQQNKPSSGQKSKTSKYKGVSWDKKNKRWLVQIQFNNKNLNLGRFQDEVEAAKHYDEMARKYHQKFAQTNFKANH